MEYFTLNNGVKMPALGFGVFQVSDPKVCEQAVIDAISVGYRLIDTAAIYGNEKAVGNAIKKSSVQREELFITTKLWISDAGYEKKKQAIDKSMKNLGVDYIDLYLIHRPFGDYYGAYRAMIEYYQAGKIKAIGLSNFGSDRMIDLVMHNDIVPSINQIEIHPFHQQTQAIEIMNEYHIQPQGWAPFAEGKNNLFNHEALKAIGQKYNKSVAQVILRWNYQRGIITIPKSIHKNRMVENIDIFDFQLSSEDMQTIAKLDLNETLFSKNEDPNYVKIVNKIKI